MLKELVYEKTDDGIRTRDFSVQSRREFHPFPTYENRDFWENADPALRKLTLDIAKSYLNYDYPAIPASAYREYYKSGDRAGFENLYDARRKALATLVLAECFTGDGRYLRDIINGIWFICEESSWVLPAHNFIYEPEAINGERTLPDPDLSTLDIFSSETAMLLSTTWYLLHERLDQEEPLVARRILRELQRRVIHPFLTRYDYWWMGYSERRDINNWAPWCIMNCITSVLFCEEEDGLRKRAVVRAMDMLETYLAGVTEDGGCNEGATYWGRSCGMLLEGFSLLYEATGGAIQVYDNQKMNRFANYIRHLFIGENYVVNFADGAARCNPAAELLYTAGCRMKDDDLADFGAYCFVWQTEHGLFFPQGLCRAMMTLYRAEDMRSRCRGPISFEKSFVLPDLGILVSREENRPENGFFLCAKAGCNNDSHNHNDVGNFVVFHNASPVVVDVGVEVYRRYFFSSDRYKIWTMQSQYHNLPTINGVMQQAGPQYKATCVTFVQDDTDSIEMDLGAAYPEQAEIESYRRSLFHERQKKRIVLRDSWVLGEAKSLELHFMTPVRPQLMHEGILFPSEKGNVVLSYDTEQWEYSLETRPLTDAKLTASWGGEMNRITLKRRRLYKEDSAEFVFQELVRGE